MKKITITLGLVVLAATTFTACKTTQVGRTAVLEMADEESALYTQLGGMRGIRLMVDKYVETAAVNPVDGEMLASGDVNLLKMDMVNEIVLVSGGPYKATRTYASRLKASPLSQSFAVAMQQCNIPQQTQNELIKKLDNSYMLAKK